MSRTEFIVRPGYNDHLVIQSLLAPSSFRAVSPNARQLVDRLIVDASVVKARPELSHAASEAGIPFVVDPMSYLWQTEVRPEDSWARLPFASSRPLLQDEFVGTKLHRRCEQVLQFEVENGATAVVPPYLYSESPNDPAFALSLQMIASTARAMRVNGISLPIMPVFAGALRSFGLQKNFLRGIDVFVRSSLEVGPERLGLLFSPVGDGKESHDKVLRMFAVCRRAQYIAGGVPAIALRQGTYGAGLVAMGLGGYETGLGLGEKTNVAASMANRKPKPKSQQGDRKGGGPLPGVYFGAFRRSVKTEAAEILLDDRSMRARLMCDDERCCPKGTLSTLEKRREHAVRTRSKEIAMLESQPHILWRLHQVARDARRGVEVAVHANKVLEREDSNLRVHTNGLDALANVADYFRVNEERRAA